MTADHSEASWLIIIVEEMVICCSDNAADNINESQPKNQLQSAGSYLSRDCVVEDMNEVTTSLEQKTFHFY